MFVQFAIVLFILCTLSWYLIRKNEHYFIVFIIILDFSLELILAKTFPSLVRISGRFTNVLLLSYLGYMVIKYRLNFFKNRFLFYAGLFTLILFIYLSLSSYYKGINPFDYFYFFRNFLFPFVFLFFFLNLKPFNKKEGGFDYVKFLLWFATFQCILGFFQRLFPIVSQYFYIPIYEKYTSDILMHLDVYYGKNPIQGTLTSSATFNGVMSLVLLFLAGLWFFKVYQPIRKMDRIYFQVYLFFLLAVVIFSGFRLGLGSIAIGTLLLMFFKKKWLFASGITTGYFLIQYIVTSYSSVIYATVTRQIGLENPLMRLMGIFAIFDPTIPDEYKLSMTRSISLSEELFENPFFGKATQYLVGQYDSITDAYLALHIIDLGFIGFFILLLPYIYTLKIVRKYCVRKAFFVMVIYFVVAIVQMLVDQGLFSQNKSHLFFLFSGICIYQFRSDRFKKHEKTVV